MAAMITGVLGGILRDILCNRTTIELYASVSLIIALRYPGMYYLGIDHTITLLVPFAGGLGIRLSALYWNWSPPVFFYLFRHWQD